MLKANKIALYFVLSFILCSGIILGQELTLLTGGDVVWCREVKAPNIYFGIKNQKNLMREDGWRRHPFIATPETRKYLDIKFDIKLETPKSHHIASIIYDIKYNSIEEENQYPFKAIRDVLSNADLTFVNLETPLTDTARYIGSFRTPTAFADAIKWSGIDVVSNANNHSNDCEGQGMMDTKHALNNANVGNIGTGKNLENARKPFVFEKNGISIAILAYTYGVNPTVTPLGFVGPNLSGSMPLDPFIIKEDINKIRDKVDFIFLSFHWGIEDSCSTHPAAREFAYEMLDAGADGIIGHHPHVPQGVEIYKGKPIIYSLGNFIFGHNHTYWGDNFLAKLFLTKSKINKVEIFPIAGEGKDVTQPYILQGERGMILLNKVKELSEKLTTTVEIKDGIGIINIE